MKEERLADSLIQDTPIQIDATVYSHLGHGPGLSAMPLIWIMRSGDPTDV